jgi:hypothetical protein
MARRLDNAAPLAAPPEPAPSAGDPAEAVPVPPSGQHLARVEAPPLPVSTLPLNLAALLLAAFLSGVLHQGLRGRLPALSGA